MSGARDEADTAIENMGYEQARDELAGIVQKLEQGGGTLEDSIALWERGEALANRCEEWLLGARRRLEEAKLGAVQEPGVETEKEAL